MVKNEKLTTAQQKIDQYKNQKKLQENRTKEKQAKLDLRRKIMVGDMFLRHFPIAAEFTPGKSSAEDDQIFKPLDDFMEALSKCQQCYHEMEDALLQSR